jgi:GNAT superfamily N-acetyltransferase
MHTLDVGEIIHLDSAQAEDIYNRLDSTYLETIGVEPEGEINLGVLINGDLIAGVRASMIEYWTMYVSTLFVDEAYRRRGIATLLMNEMEKQARALGAKMIRLDTFSWQGVEFYQQLGYEEIGHYTSSDGDYSEYFFLKRLE